VPPAGSPRSFALVPVSAAPGVLRVARAPGSGAPVPLLFSVTAGVTALPLAVLDPTAPPEPFAALRASSADVFVAVFPVASTTFAAGRAFVVACIETDCEPLVPTSKPTEAVAPASRDPVSIEVVATADGPPAPLTVVVTVTAEWVVAAIA
jgi:hypothetical protein